MRTMEVLNSEVLYGNFDPIKNKEVFGSFLTVFARVK